MPRSSILRRYDANVEMDESSMSIPLRAAPPPSTIVRRPYL
jgi:hypothetical protein